MILSNFRNLLTCFLFAVLLCVSAYGQQPQKNFDELTRDEVLKLSNDDLLQLSLEDLMALAEKLGCSVDDLLNMKITVSSGKAVTPRESPGIISIVTAEEIKSSGARDLTDVLERVPGFNLGYDIDGVIGLGIRGNWAHEGKVLILLDGLEVNENFYSTFQLGNHLPVDQIKRIEIIRGPGSSMYGGYAELGVINIITKDGSDVNGFSVNESAGFTDKGWVRSNHSLMVGQQKKDFRYSLGGYWGEGQRSDQQYTNFDENTYDLAGTDGRVRSRNLNLAMGYKDLNMRLVYDDFQTRAYEYDSNPLNRFSTYMGELKYDYKPSNKLTITPRLVAKSQMPYYMNEADYFYKKQNNRYLGSVVANYEVTKNFTLLGGGEWNGDFATDLSDDEASVFANGKKNVEYNNLSAFLQGFLKTPWLNINLGGRYDNHSQFGDNFSPRIGITRVINKFHFKLLYSQAFRAPSIENIALNEHIKPERTYTTELEAGYQLNKSMFITANVFDIRISDLILYSYTDEGEELYLNSGSTGTRGFELEYRLRKDKGNLTVNYAYYMAPNNEVPDYEALNNYLLAFPSHKIGLIGSYNVTRTLSISPGLTFIGQRYGYTKLDVDGNPELNKIEPQIMANVYGTYQFLYVKGLSIGAGVYNLLNEKTQYIQPYNGWFPPVPGIGREYVVKLTYDFMLNR